MALGLDIIDIRMRLRGARQTAAEARAASAAIASTGTAAQTASAKSATAASKTNRLRDSYRRLGRSMGFVAGFLGIGGALAFGSAIKDTQELAKATRGLQRYTGMEAHTASAWVQLAKQRDIATRSLNMSFLTLGRNIRGARQGGETQIRNFAQLGIEADKIKKMNTDEVLLAMADAFSEMEGGAQKAAIAQALLGRGAQQVLPIIDSGSNSVRKLVAQQEKMGNTIGQDQVDQSLKAVQAQRELMTSLNALKVTIGVAVMPVFTKLVNGLKDWVEGMKEGKTWAVVIGGALLGLIAAFLILGVVAAVSWAVALGPVALIIAGVAILVGVFFALYQKVTAFRNAVNAVWGFIKKFWPFLLGPLIMPFAMLAKFAIKHFGTIKRIVRDVYNWVKQASKDVVSFVKGLWGGIGSGARAGMNIVAGAVQSVLNSIIDMINWVIDKVDDLPGVGNLHEIGPITLIGGAAPGTGGGNIASGRQPGRGVGRSVLSPSTAVGPSLSLPARQSGREAVEPLTGDQKRGIINVIARLYLDGRQVAESTTKQAEDKAARR